MTLSIRRTVTVAASVMLLVGAYVRLYASAWSAGDVIVSISNSSYNVYDHNGIFKETISWASSADGSGDLAGGCAFDSSSNLYTTNFSDTHVVKFDGNDPHAVLQIINDAGPSEVPAASSESIVFATNGDFYVGHADGNHNVHRYNSAGVFQQAYAVASEDRGSDHITLASDQKTLWYTSEGRKIKRYDVSTSTQLSDFVTLPGSLETTGETLFAVRLLPPGDGSGGLLVADYANIKRLDALGNVVATYDVPGEPGENSWFALNLDPNGTSFWSGGLESSNFYRFSILTGAIEVGPINTGAPGGTMGGICLKSEPTGSGTTVTKTFPAGQTTKQRYDFVTHAFELTFTPNENLDVAVNAQPTTLAADWVTAFAPTATCLPYGPTCILYSLPNPPQPTQYSGLIHVYIDYFVPINACRPRLLHLFETGPKAGTVEDMTRDYYPPPSIPSIDPIGGDTDGFSQFQAVDLGDPDGPLQNAFAGFVKPNPDGTSLITSGRTLPVLFKFTGAPPVARLSVEKIQNTVTGFVLQDTDAPGNSFTDNLFKCDSLTKQCQYNLKTTGFMTGTYVIVVNADTFCVQTVRFSVR